MADATQPSAPRQSGEFTENAVLHTIVPFSTSIDIESELSRSLIEHQTDNTLELGIRQRPHVFFDESIAVYIVLQTQYIEEDVLKSYLSRLAISLDVHIVNERNSQHSKGDDVSTGAGGSTRDLVFSETAKEDDDPLVIVQNSHEDDNTVGSMLVVWRMDVALNRPRSRINNPLVQMSAAAHLRPTDEQAPDIRAEEYMPSGVPAALNLLESFSSDPTFAEVKPRLSALRVSRIAPVTPITKELLRPLRSGSQKVLPILPAVGSRVRYSKLNGSSGRPTIIASLDFDVIPGMDCEVRLEEVTLELSRGKVTDLTNTDDLQLPIDCRARDNLTFLYQLVASQDMDQRPQQTSNTRTLTISMLATILVAEDCRPSVRMRWQSSVDFSTVLNPAYGGPSPVLQRSHRPSSLPTPSSSETPHSDQSTSAARPETGASGKGEPAIQDAAVAERPSSMALGNLGLTITCTGPHDVFVGEAFRWDIFLVNRSERARKLALVVIPRRKSGDVKKAHSRPLSSGSAAARASHTADAVLDENILYAMQRSSVTEPAEIVTLSTEVRVGPLPPSACHTTELRFLPLAVGVLHIEALRVVDLSTQQAVDIRDLPCIISRRRDS